MRYKKFGKTGLDISAITVGTWAIGGKNWGAVEKHDSIDAIHAMIDNGVNSIDTAPAYGFGFAEEVVGEALKGIRDHIIITTKCGIEWQDGVEGFIKNASKAKVIKGCEDSLKRLQTDHIDLFMIHWPDINTPIEETMEALSTLKGQGKILHVGVSNFSREEIIEADKYCKVEVLQPPFSMVNRTAEKLMKWSEEFGLGIMTYGSLGAGILTGSIRKLPKYDKNDFRLTFYDFFTEPKFSKVMDLLKTLDSIAEKHGKPVSQVAINWSIQKSYVNTSLIGVRNRKEADENCDAMSWQLSDDEINIIDQAIDKHLGKVE